jgi:hypothetical protein
MWQDRKGIVLLFYKTQPAVGFLLPHERSANNDNSSVSSASEEGQKMALSKPSGTAVNPVTEQVRPASGLRFLSGWTQSRRGYIQPGAVLTIDYDPARLPQCRRERLGVPIWEMRAFVRFHPGEQFSERPVISRGTPDIPTGPVPVKVDVPADAQAIELWFQVSNILGCSAWDTRFGQNYWYPVLSQVPTIPNQSVSYRWGAQSNLEMVYLVSDAVRKIKHFFGTPQFPGGSELRTVLAVRSSVRNLAFEKNAWLDVHVFDGEDNLIHSETFTMHYLGPGPGGGDRFGFDDVVYHGSGGGSGMGAWFRPDARKVQYRLYYEVNNQIFTDGLLHQQEIDEDGLAVS